MWKRRMWNDYFIAYTKKTSKWVKDINIIAEIIKFLNENTKKIFLTLALAIFFFKYGTKNTGNRQRYMN